MTTETDFQKVNARVTALELALAYTITNLSAKFSDTKPAVIEALRNDASLNPGKKDVQDALLNLANLFEQFKIKN